MTDPAPKPAAPKRPVARVPSSSVTVAGAAVVFLGALGGIGAQMATGNDPALGPVKRTATVASTPAAAAARRVLDKRIHRRVVVTRIVTDAAPAPVVAATPSAPASAVAAPRSPVVRTSAPVPQAAAPAPAPAPAPPPVQTASS